MLVIIPLTIALDGVRLVLARAGVSALVGVSACAFGLAVIMSALCAPGAAALLWLCRRMRRTRALQWLWQLPAALIVTALSWATLNPSAHRASELFAALALASG